MIAFLLKKMSSLTVAMALIIATIPYCFMMETLLQSLVQPPEETTNIHCQKGQKVATYERFENRQCHCQWEPLLSTVTVPTPVAFRRAPDVFMDLPIHFFYVMMKTQYLRQTPSPPPKMNSLSA